MLFLDGGHTLEHHLIILPVEGVKMAVRTKILILQMLLMYLLCSHNQPNQDITQWNQKSISLVLAVVFVGDRKSQCWTVWPKMYTTVRYKIIAFFGGFSCTSGCTFSNDLKTNRWLRISWFTVMRYEYCRKVKSSSVSCTTRSRTLERSPLFTA